MQDFDETQDAWYPLWCHYANLIYVESVIPNADPAVWLKGIQARSRAIKTVRDTLINNYPEFFTFVEWGLDDLTGHGDPICDEYIEKYFPYGIPKDFKFYFASTQKDFDDNWYETGAYTGEAA